MHLKAITLALVCQLCLAIVCLADTTLADKIQQAVKGYAAAKEAASCAYRKAFSEALGAEMKVEIYLLGPADNPTTSSDEDPFLQHLAEDLFPILPYKSAAKILQRKLLSPEEIAQLLPSLKTTIIAENQKNDRGMGCHKPIHALRIWDGETLIFQTSICYHCKNFYLKDPDGESHWINLTDPAFQKVMEQLMPIPTPSEPKKPQTSRKNALKK